jgi:hypothetical protein
MRPNSHWGWIRRERGVCVAALLSRGETRSDSGKGKLDGNLPSHPFSYHSSCRRTNHDEDCTVLYTNTRKKNCKQKSGHKDM